MFIKMDLILKTNNKETGKKHNHNNNKKTLCCKTISLENKQEIKHLKLKEIWVV